VLIIEGLARTKRYQVLKDAFHIEGGSQCGICTPGMIMAAESLLSDNPHPTDEEIRIGLSGNLCRCTGYNMIIKAVKTAAKLGEGLW
ncbi:MAG: 2Fe-2S iron-sulfur cluster-binding protein, partial [Bacilli bacterium]